MVFIALIVLAVGQMRVDRRCKKMSYVCQECGTEYGDPSLDEIPIVCSECVGGTDVEPEDDDSGELFG